MFGSTKKKLASYFVNRDDSKKYWYYLFSAGVPNGKYVYKCTFVDYPQSFV